MEKYSLFILIAVFYFVHGQSYSDQDEPSCSSRENPNDLEVLKRWIETNPVLIEQDREKDSLFVENTLNTASPLDAVRSRFYRMTIETYQNVCLIPKRFGGHWISGCGAFESQKLVCMDKLYHDIMKGECLVYSFGIGDNWSFEMAMANLGCKVRAFDILDATAEEFLNHENITFSQKGIFGKVSEFKFERELKDGGRAPLVTLEQAMELMGDAGKRISYLKVDVEGDEIKTIPNWIKTGILSRIDQIGMEFHTGNGNIKKKNLKSTYLGLINNLIDLHKAGFRIIYYEPNICMGKVLDFTKQYTPLFDVVFSKV